MASVSVTMIIPTILFIIVILTFKRMERRKVLERLPLGNMGMPFIGETIAFMQSHPPNILGDFMIDRISRYGKIFSSHLFGNLCIVSADPEFNKFVLNGNYFGNGLPRAFVKVIGKYSMALMAGDAHKDMRSTILEFLSAESLRSVFLQDADHIASQIIGSWSDGQVISATDEATKFSLSIMLKKMLSMSIGDPGIEKLPKEYGNFIRAFTSIPLYIPGTGYWKAIKSREKIISMFKLELEVRNKKQGSKIDGKDQDDFIGWLMKNTDFPPEKIYDTLLGVLFAGHDGTSRAISLSIYFLEKCPQAVQQLREEHLQVVRSKQQGGESKLTLDDIKSMEFTRCVINETLRLVASFLLRKATADVKYKDFVIPKGSTVVLHNAAVHLDPSFYEDPEHFNPWRWLSPSSIKVSSCYMPFGRGVRMCPGAELSRLEMAVFLHHLILKCNWKQAEPDHPVRNLIIEFPKGLPIKIQTISTCPN